jgi:hypothetical protein
MNEDNGQKNTSDTASFVQEVFRFLRGREYFIPLVISFFVLILASGTELNIFGAEIKPGEDKIERGILLAIAVICLAITLILWLRKSKGVDRNSLERAWPATQHDFPEPERPTKNSESEERLFNDVKLNLAEIEIQKIVARSLSEWLNAKEKKERWIEKATLSALSSYKDFIPLGKEEEFKDDLAKYFEILSCALRSGNRPCFRGDHAIEAKIPYEGALFFLEKEILNSYDNSSDNIFRDERERGRKFLSQFINELKNDLNQF